jgi:LysM repeat protein
MRGTSRKRFTLMPLIAIAGLSLVVTLPALSATQLHAAKPVTYTTVIVKSGDSLWNLADESTPRGGDIQATVDAIIAVNHLTGAAIAPGQHLNIPQ